MLFILCFWSLIGMFAQTKVSISGSIIESRQKEPLKGVLVQLQNHALNTVSVSNGKFSLEIPSGESCILKFTLSAYLDVYLEIAPNSSLDLGIIELEKNVVLDGTSTTITLSETELEEESVSNLSSGLLQATRDLFLSRAAYDFGPLFFRVRGYGSEQGTVLMNGVSMNKLYNRRPQWGNWTGLNDAMRNQELVSFLSYSPYGFGNLLGANYINTAPSALRKGLRISSSMSNKTYTGRIMATYNAKSTKNGFHYLISASKRWGSQGYISGTLYDAYSISGALEYKINKQNRLLFTGVWSYSNRGKSSALTQEVTNLVGTTYNPYWGILNGEKVNSKQRLISEPFFQLLYTLEKKRWQLRTNVLYQIGKQTNSRVGYFNAPNPDPNYYRYVPSFYINSPLGANFVNADLARQGFIKQPQWDWNALFTANKNATDGKAAYVWYKDVVSDNLFAVNTVANLKISQKFKLDFGVDYKSLTTSNYAEISNLLGAEYHLDQNPFTKTFNDLTKEPQKNKGDKFSYNYTITATKTVGFLQLKYDNKSLTAFLSTKYGLSNYIRVGLFKNGTYPENSLGKSEKLGFTNYGVKAGLHYQLNGRHWLQLHAATIEQEPTLQNSFINPREHNLVVPNLKTEKINSIEANYFMRIPNFNMKISGFYTRFQDLTEVSSFFIDAGVGSEFVQEVISNLDKLHKGIELGASYSPSTTVKLSAVAAIGNYEYANNPNLTINFDTVGTEEETLNLTGYIDLGEAAIKNYRLPQGPQMAFSLGVSYRDPKYWWISATANELRNSFIAISEINRTANFLINPETNTPFVEATPENVANLLVQEKLPPMYLLNLVGGKSWLIDGRYISVFVSVQNLFNSTYRTGGYEQNRNGNYGQLRDDNLSGSPSFAPKYWNSYGRTYFLNCAISF